ncbi:MAG: hypothetical protein WCU88_04685 [Elusimicrobiota bacterium]
MKRAFLGFLTASFIWAAASSACTACAAGLVQSQAGGVLPGAFAFPPATPEQMNALKKVARLGIQDDPLRYCLAHLDTSSAFDRAVAGRVFAAVPELGQGSRLQQIVSLEKAALDAGYDIERAAVAQAQAVKAAALVRGGLDAKALKKEYRSLRKYESLSIEAGVSIRELWSWKGLIAKAKSIAKALQAEDGLQKEVLAPSGHGDFETQESRPKLRAYRRMKNGRAKELPPPGHMAFEEQGSIPQAASSGYSEPGRGHMDF